MGNIISLYIYTYHMPPKAKRPKISDSDRATLRQNITLPPHEEHVDYDDDEEDNDANPDIYRIFTMIDMSYDSVLAVAPGPNNREAQVVDRDEYIRLQKLLGIGGAISGSVRQTIVKPTNGAPHNRLVVALLFIKKFITELSQSILKKTPFSLDYVTLLDAVINDSAMKSRKNWTGKKGNIDDLMTTFINYVIKNRNKQIAVSILTQLLYIIFGKSLSDQRQFSTTVRAIPGIKITNSTISPPKGLPRTICHTIQESVNTAFISADNAAVAGFLLMQCSNDYLMHAHTVKAAVGGEKQPIMIQRGEVWALSILCDLASSVDGIQMFENIINAYVQYLNSGNTYNLESYGKKLTQAEIFSIFLVFQKIAIDTSTTPADDKDDGPPPNQTGINTFCSKIKSKIKDQMYNTNSKLIEECFNQLFAKSGDAFDQRETDLHTYVCSFIEELSSIDELNETCLLFAKLLKTVSVFNPTLAKDIDVSHWAKHLADEVYTGLWRKGETSITLEQSHANKEYNNCLDALIIPLLDMICHDFESLPSIIKLMEYISKEHDVKTLIQNRNNPGKPYDVVSKIKSYQSSNASIKTTEDAVLTVCCDVSLSFCATLVDGKIRVRLDHQHNLFLDHEIIGMKVPCVDISFLYTSILKTSLANDSVNKRLYCTIDLGKANMEPFAEFLRAIPLNSCVTARRSAATNLENALEYIQKGGNADALKQVLKDTHVVVIRSPADDVDPGGKYMGKPFYIDSEPVAYQLPLGITVIIEEKSNGLDQDVADAEWMKYMVENTASSGQYIFPHSANLVGSLNRLFNTQTTDEITNYYKRAASSGDDITLNDYYTGEIDLALGTLLNTMWEPTKIKEKLCNTMKKLKDSTYNKYLDNKTRKDGITIDISRNVALVVLKHTIGLEDVENDLLKIGVDGVSDAQKQILLDKLSDVQVIFERIHGEVCSPTPVENIIHGFLIYALFTEMSGMENEIIAQVYVSLFSRVVGDISTIDNQIPRTGSVRFRGMISEDTDSVSLGYYTSKAKGKGNSIMVDSGAFNDLARKSINEQQITHRIRPIDNDRAVGLGFGTPDTRKVKVNSTSYSAKKQIGKPVDSPGFTERRSGQIEQMKKNPAGGPAGGIFPAAGAGLTNVSSFEDMLNAGVDESESKDVMSRRVDSDLEIDDSTMAKSPVATTSYDKMVTDGIYESQLRDASLDESSSGEDPNPEYGPQPDDYDISEWESKVDSQNSGRQKQHPYRGGGTRKLRHKYKRKHTHRKPVQRKRKRTQRNAAQRKRKNNTHTRRRR